MQKMQEQFSVTIWVTPNGHNGQCAPRSVVGITDHAERYAGWALLFSIKISKKNSIFNTLDALATMGLPREYNECFGYQLSFLGLRI